MTGEKKQFNADVSKILSLMINSIYTNKEIFMRELISNSSDAFDKLRYLSRTNDKLIGNDNDFKIVVSVDKDSKLVTIFDNGIGMNEEELNENLGTIAKSGTQNFAQQLSGDAKKDSMLIGQFGVGFYSSFMIADKISVISKKAGESKAHMWVSDGLGEYTVSESKADFTRGTKIILHIKDSEENFLDHFQLKHIVKSYSDHIAVPIFFIDEDGNQIQVNSSSALWTRAKSEITPEQYEEFYRTVSHSADKPWLTLHNKNEGAIEFTNLLFIPENKTFDLFHPDRKSRVKLYIKRVFIADEAVSLIPSYLRFLRGVIDSEDLPLNISRETLQQNATVEKIKKSVTKRVLSELKKKKDNAAEEYIGFWENFGGALKEGLCEVTSDHEKLLEVCIFKSALHNKMISLDEYIKNCKPEQKTIYFLSGDDAEKLRNNPQIEGFLSKKIDVLLFTDTVDDFWVNVNARYKDFEIKSVTRSDIDIEDDNSEPKQKDKESEKEIDDATNSTLTTFFKEVLGDLVKDVKISKKLTSSPACLVVADGAMDIRMERFLIEQKQLAGASAKILEINPNHRIIANISDSLNDKSKVEDTRQLVYLLYDQACIIEGEPVTDAGAFSKRLNNILEKI
ncbi:MAG: molecular chaperone HtpG [Rickettsiaceae bacterium]|nr:molecular chaperone HtpG [Rickettsiaceae bacterium]